MNILKFILAIVFITVASVSVSAVDDIREKIESLRKSLPSLEGPERLNACSLIYEHTLKLGGHELELGALYPYLHEARRQNDERKTGHAMMQRLCTFYNYGMNDSLSRYYPESMAFFERIGDWGKYYYAALLQVQSHANADRHIMAMNNARQLYREARIQDNDYGIGATAYILGDVYFRRGDNDVAHNYIDEAIEHLKNAHDPTILFKAYDRMWTILSNKNAYRNALEVLLQWEKTIETRAAKPETNNDHMSADNSLVHCWCGMARMYSKLHMFPDARAYLEKAESLAGNKTIYLSDICRAKSVFSEESGDYGSAAEWYRRTIPQDWGYSSSHEGFEAASVFAGLLGSGGYYREASEVYARALSFADKMRTSGIEAQLKELEDLYRFDKMEARTRNIQILSSIIIFALLSVFTIYFVYGCRLRHKNRALSEQLREVNRLRTWQLAHLPKVMEAEGSGAPADNAGEGENGSCSKKNEAIVWLACRRMADEKLFCDPGLNRKQLADMLGTNENYLAAAIREVNDGQTVGDFINGFRLDYACGLITEFPHMKLETIAQESGLMTRSTLFRLFLKKYGMSPSQYRTEQIKEIKAV